jgi:hypothetical protein
MLPFGRERYMQMHRLALYFNILQQLAGIHHFVNAS